MMAIVYKNLWTGGGSSSTTSTGTINFTNSNFINTVVSGNDTFSWGDTQCSFEEMLQSHKKIPLALDWKGEIAMPDGARILLNGQGSYEIEDKDAKVIYKANRIRDFNKFLNASDIMEDFIRTMGQLGASQLEVLQLPVELFINFLILRSAQADDIDPPKEVQLALPSPIKIPRCKSCGRFIRKVLVENGVNFCNETHMLIFIQRKGLG